MAQGPERLRIDMPAEEVWENLRVSGANTEYMAAAQGLLNLKLVERLGGRLVELSSHLTQLNKSLHAEMESNDKAAAASLQQSRNMVRWTRLLVGVTLLQVFLVGWYTIKTDELTNIAGKQLAQSEVNSTISNTPYVEVHPTYFSCEPTDQNNTSAGFDCSLLLEIMNHSQSVPAVEAVLNNVRLGQEKTEYVIAKDVSTDSNTIFPGLSVQAKVLFHMNPKVFQELYDNGRKELLIHSEVTYTVRTSSGNRPKYSYWCDWTYKRLGFDLKRSGIS